MHKVKILKPHQNGGIWFTVGQIVDVTELRAKDLIEAGLAEVAQPEEPQSKPRLATQAKPRQSASTKTVAVVEPISQLDGNTDSPQGNPSADLLEQNADQQTADNNNDQG
ncbi:hypothetical protein [Undibacterium sp.]|uniref:DUF7210 family protein n=1 Tax=Undibacterium sp. TaxID=1914977 RepID=UPI0037516931